MCLTFCYASYLCACSTACYLLSDVLCCAFSAAHRPCSPMCKGEQISCTNTKKEVRNRNPDATHAGLQFLATFFAAHRVCVGCSPLHTVHCADAPLSPPTPSPLPAELPLIAVLRGFFRTQKSAATNFRVTEAILPHIFRFEKKAVFGRTIEGGRGVVADRKRR